MSFEGDLLHNIKNGSLVDLIPISKITKENITSLKQEGYMAEITYEEHKELFPWLPVDKIYLGKNSINGAVYYDPTKYICCEMSIFGRVYLSMSNEQEGKDALKRIQLCEEAYEKGNYRLLLNVCPVDAYRLELLSKMIEDNPNQNFLELFKEIFPRVDFGFQHIKNEQILSLYQRAPQSHFDKIKKRFGKNKTITIYRGQGEKSQSYTKAMSWTLDINTAYFFAVRFSKDGAYICKAEVNSDDILDYIDERGEKEVIVNPEKVNLIKGTYLHGYDFIPGQNLPADFFEKAKQMYWGKSQDHGANHICRMLLLNHLMAPELGISAREKRILHNAILYHDLGREDDSVDIHHGLKSAQQMEQLEPKMKDKDIVMSIMTYHCHDDQVGVEALSKMPDGELRVKLLKILKDIDALDRVRFGVRGLNVKTLRNEVSYEFVLIANLLLQFKY